jgi:alkylation response protein AidB-like acyl-CoA dehydrogenase
LLTGTPPAKVARSKDEKDGLGFSIEQQECHNLTLRQISLERTLDMLDLTWTPAQAAFRLEARSWLTANLAEWQAAHCPISSGDTAVGFKQHLAWERRLFDSQWAAICWPSELGGRDSTLWEWLIFEEEYYAAGAPPRVTQNGIFLLAPVLFAVGTEQQKQYILPRMAAGLDTWCQGWSEPDSGSDLASLKSTATKVDGGWELNGAKTWTTSGAFCSHLFGLFRTGPAGGRHRGLTYFLVPLDTQGITVRGFNRLDGDEGFAEVFFDQAFIPDELPYGSPVLGGVDQGWSVAMSTTTSERGLTLRSPGRFMATAERMIELANEKLSAGSESSGLRDRVIDAWMHAEAYRVQTLQTVSASLQNIEAGAETSLVKLWWSELDIELHQVVLDLRGEEAELDEHWSKGWQFSLSGPIYAGTNEIQRNIAAERFLGLPKGS